MSCKKCEEGTSSISFLGGQSWVDISYSMSGGYTGTRTLTGCHLGLSSVLDVERESDYWLGHHVLCISRWAEPRMVTCCFKVLCEESKWPRMSWGILSNTLVKSRYIVFTQSDQESIQWKHDIHLVGQEFLQSFCKSIALWSVLEAS